MYVQRSKFGGEFDKFGGKPFKKLKSKEFMEFVFSKSGIRPGEQGIQGLQKFLEPGISTICVIFSSSH